MSSDEEDVHAGGPRKRRRLNINVEPSSEDVPEPSSDSPQSLLEEPGALHESEPQERSKPRYKIHLVQNTAGNLAEDGIYTQPPATEEDHRIRGAHWVKTIPQLVQLPRVPSFPGTNTAALAPRSRESAETNTVSTGGIFTRQSPPPGRAMLRDIPPPIHEIPDEHFGDDVEAALLEELAGFRDEELQNIGRADAGPQDSVDVSDQEISSQDLLAIQEAQRCDILVAPRNNLRQTTLFGVAVRDDGTATQESQSNRVLNWPAANREEPATHHKLDEEAMETWLYPTNLGTIRDYQFNIVSRGLYHNLLVALPTGLGKTFIAATIMLNWFRWTKDSQIVFMAPTKPLVAQQVDACFNIAGIPRSTTTLLTGQTPPALRAEEWKSKRVFFMTPQTFNNDLKSGICDPKRIVLVVVDEAHRATGNYSYCEVITFLRRFNTSFRVLALTATPGSTVEAVQQVIDGLGIARTEIRTEDSLDIRQYVHHRNIDTEVFQYNEDMERVMELISPAIQPVLNKVASMNIYHSKDPIAITAYGCMMSRQKWQKSPAGRSANFGLKGMVNSVFNVLASLGHALGLLKFHGIGPFFHKICKPSDTDKKENKYERQIREHPDFKKMLAMCRAWTTNPEFLGHPKLEYLSSVVLNHFIDRGEGRETASGSPPAATRIMIFAHFRDSAEEIVRVLKRHDPMVRPHIFVGQANTSGSDGMDQKKQIDIIDKFKKGTYNTLVATSIGEEGLDIGEVDLIVCYDASASPIRMLQRMGRTGRKRAGNIVVLLMERKEKDDFEKAKDNYEKMQQMIAEGSRFAYHDALSPRIIPKGTVPVVDKRAVEIPIENSQADLPEPKKRKGKLPKRPPKKFHIPDNVITGFVKASNMGGDKPTASKRVQRARSPTPDPVPDIEQVLLTDLQTVDLEERFLNITGEQSEVVEYPGLNKHALLQRRPRPTAILRHGRATNKTIKMFKTMRGIDEDALQDLQDHLHPDDKELADKAYIGEVVMELENEPPVPEPVADFEFESEPEIKALNPAKRRQPVQKARAEKKQKTKPKAKTNPAKKGPKTRIAPAPKNKTKRATRMPSSLQRDSSDMEAHPSPTQHPSSHADMGIDIMNTDDGNDPEEGDDDDGSDLTDFIDDGAQVENVPSSSDSLMAVPRRNSKAPKQRRPIPRAIEPSSDQLEDEDELLPNLEDLLGPVQKVKPRRERGRKILVDSDDED